MIILDTNIVSEFMISQPADSVLQWMNQQQPDSLYLTSITIAEISYGLGAMPTGKRQKLLTDGFEAFIKNGFSDRVLSFDFSSAKLYGDIMSHKKAIGRPMSVFDGQIAAIAKLTGFSIATRNVKDFKECDIDIINPFDFGDL